jgi:hypothetical protein
MPSHKTFRIKRVLGKKAKQVRVEAPCQGLRGCAPPAAGGAAAALRASARARSGVPAMGPPARRDGCSAGTSWSTAARRRAGTRPREAERGTFPPLLRARQPRRRCLAPRPPPEPADPSLDPLQDG